MLAVGVGLVLERVTQEQAGQVVAGPDYQVAVREQRLVARQTLAAAAAALETGKQQALEAQALW